jgi:hypothetical protein
MNEALFDVVFKGKFVRQIDQEKAVLHFSKLFKMTSDKAQKFFDGKPRTLKKSLSLDKASHFRAALKKAGLRVSMVKQAEPDNQQQTETITMEEVGATIVDKPFVQPKHFDTSQFSLDEVGIELVHPEHIETPEFDLSEYGIDEVGVQFAEKPEIPEPNIDISDLSIEEVDTPFAEKPDIPEPEFDLSELDIDEVGVVLVKKENVPEPEINIDGIKLL